jgi:hypothetical protein
MRLRSLALSGVILLASPEARGNGRFPAASQLVGSPRDPSFLALRTTFGILVSHDGGKAWDWICETAIGYGGTVQDPPLGMMQLGLVAGTTRGLAASLDDGCSWSFALDEPVIDLVVRRDDTHAALVLTSRYVAPGDSGLNTYSAKVFATRDDGAHWAEQGGAIDPGVLVETIEIAASDPHRVYLSGARETIAADGAIAPVGVIYTSMDDGAHYVKSEIALDAASESAPFISAVDPANADRLYVRVKGTHGSRVLVSDDAGKTFRTVFTGAGDLLGFALSGDGAMIYVGGPKDGLLAASRTALSFEKRSSTPVQCLAAMGNTLYACTSDSRGYAGQSLQVSTDDGATLVPMFHLSCVRGALGCPAASPTAACASNFSSTVGSILGPSQCDGGVIAPADGGSAADAAGGGDVASEDAGGAGSDANGRGSAHDGGCGAGGGGAGSTAISAFALLLAFAARRGRRRRA